MRKLRVGDVLTRIKESITIEDHQKYKRVTIKMKHQGVFLRDIEIGAEIGTKNQFLIREGQFLLSKIDARNGAFGIVPAEADGAIITGNFWAFDVNQKELNIDLFHIMTSLPFFDELSKKASSGTTNRQYLDEKKFLGQEITIPSIEEQDAFIAHFKKLQSAQAQTFTELQTQSDLIAKLRASILSDAVSGRLVPQDPADEPASVLIQKIRAQKERLIKEGKIKREKPLPPIKEDEIPYELPEGWVWCRLQDIGSIKRGMNPKYSISDDTQILNQKCIRWFKIEPQHAKTVSKDWLNNLDDDCFAKIGDVLVNSTGDGTIGRSAIVSYENECLAFDSHILKISSTINAKYISQFIRPHFKTGTMFAPSSVVQRRSLKLWNLQKSNIKSLNHSCQRARRQEDQEQMIKRPFMPYYLSLEQVADGVMYPKSMEVA